MPSIGRLVSATYSHFQKMDAHHCSLFLELIEYPYFTMALCDQALADPNVIKIPSKYERYRKSEHKPFDLKKLLYYAFKTVPLDSNNLKSVH